MNQQNYLVISKSLKFLFVDTKTIGKIFLGHDLLLTYKWKLNSKYYNTTLTQQGYMLSTHCTLKLSIKISPNLINMQPSNFNYLVSSMIRVNNTFLDKSPDYFVDFAPDSSTSFWKQWFR